MHLPKPTLTWILAGALGTALAMSACSSTHEPHATGTEPLEQVEPAHALAASELVVAEGFTAELIYSVPSATHGSWVSLCADDRGRLYTSDQYGRLWRVTPPPPGKRTEPRVEQVNVELGEAQGLLWAFDSLYVVVNAGGQYESGLYRVRDTDGDDALDSVELLRPFEGNGEHGPHAVMLTPAGDGLVVIAGNHTDLPDYVERSRVPRVWGEDVLLPRMDDPVGHAVGITEPGGWVCRTDPDGKDWELIACGFRNPYDGAFDPSGELFTFDADMEYDTGLPWYRPTRILHVVSGAEFGWRAGSGKWPDWTPDSLGSVVDIGLTSPTGVAFGTGAHFPGHWRRALFAADWAWGKIYAVHMEPSGATYTGRFELFVTGEPLPVTDLTVSTDGALYFTTGGRRTQSGLYRITWDGAYGAPLGEPESAAAVDDLTLRRRALEAQHLEPNARSLDAAWAELDDPDRNLRFAARTLIELHDSELWQQRALAEGRERASIEALLALVRCHDALEPDAWLSAAMRWPWESLGRARLLAALRVVGLGLVRIPGADRVSSPLDKRLLALLPSGDDTLDRELCRVLARMQSAGLVQPGLELLESAPTQESAIDLAYSLSTLQVGWSDPQRARMLRWFHDGTREFAGGRSFEEYLDEIRTMAMASLGTSIGKPNPAVAESNAEAQAIVPAAAFVRNWTAQELAPHLARVASDRSFERGREVYLRTRCFECHRIAGDGGSTGPDLSGTAGRFNATDLLDSLLSPSAVISDQYQDTEVWTSDGGVIVGRLVEIDQGLLTLRNAQDEHLQVHESDIETQRPHPLSRMPEGLLDTCSVEEILDVLAYVLAGGDAQHDTYD
ncbi:MAG: putative heme-binding domain-containing protein [Chlamydiales bacterium]|jgi:putative heme-binding domain-containing protein